MRGRTGLGAGRPRGRLRRLSVFLTAVAAGGLAGAAHPPFGFLPGLLGYAVLLLLLDDTDAERPRRSAFFRGWAAGAGYLLISTYWVAEAFYVDAARHGWMAPFAVAAICFGIGLFWGAAGLLYRVLAGSRLDGRPVRPLVFAACFGLLEWLRGHVLTGFPWNLPGEAFAAGSPMSQLAAVFGSYGLSVLVLAVCSAPALLAQRASVVGKAAVAGALAAATFGGWAWGAARLNAAPVAARDAPLVRVIQPNVDQKDKWRPENLDEIVATYVRLTTQPSARRPDIIVWPEASIPAAANNFLNPSSPQFRRIAGALQPGQILLLGAYRLEPGSTATAPPVAYNSLIALQRTPGALEPLAIYDKYRLVPFGEYLPFSWLLGPIGFGKMAQVSEGFEHGPRPAPVSLRSAPRVQPLICYESLYPGFVSSEGGRPQWIVNVSNDAWFGRTSGPWQHLNIASYRAIEQGLPLVRSTPTGVSAVVDAMGRPLAGAVLPIGAQGVIDRVLPPALEPTPYESVGDLLFWMLIIGFGLTAAPRLTMSTRRR